MLGLRHPKQEEVGTHTIEEEVGIPELEGPWAHWVQEVFKVVRRRRGLVNLTMTPISTPGVKAKEKEKMCLRDSRLCGS